MHLLILNPILLLSGNASGVASTGSEHALNGQGQHSNDDDDEGDGSSNTVNNHPVGKLPSIYFFYLFLCIQCNIYFQFYTTNITFFLYFIFFSTKYMYIYSAIYFHRFLINTRPQLQAEQTTQKWIW